MNKFYDKQSKPITMEEWGNLTKDNEYKRVAQDTLPDGKWVSTVWVGLDMGLDDGEPMIFETMVFPSKENMLDIECKRYSTLEEAEKGHKEMVNKQLK